MERWTGRVAIVTGASSGIGAGIARLLAENGMKVVGVARRMDHVKVLSLFIV
jgi:NADP-dependent 3-hydroxy acid dehydrogenase YdfG